ncbi:MAG: hypothetical protein M3463_11325 [Verrucomicrobiota bacterium]|nr:hypothetical protein [Verrucomicrobiota bacterium]
MPPIERFEDEIALVLQEAARLLNRAGVNASLPPDVAELLVTTFRELRGAKTAEGRALEPLTTPMSTAEGGSAPASPRVCTRVTFGSDRVTRSPIACTSPRRHERRRGRPQEGAPLFQSCGEGTPGAHWQAYYEARKRLE